jgi:hypothetical protein
MLSVISGGAGQVTPTPPVGGPSAAAIVAPAVPTLERARRRTAVCRPTDALEPWRVDVTPALRRLASAAAEVGLTLDTAAALVVERVLVVRERALEGVVNELDARAAASLIRQPLSAATAAYLRTLTSGAVRPSSLGGRRAALALPARLTDRIGSARSLRDLVEPQTLDSALTWERAAVVGGWTLTEWAVGEAFALRA